MNFCHITCNYLKQKGVNIVSNINIRIADARDLENIYDIDRDYDHERYSKDVILSSLKMENYYNIILSIDDVDIGYLSAMTLLDECELLKIVIKRDYRSKGYGKILINTLKDYCAEKCVEKIYLEVRSDNIVAKNVYIKNGFILNGVRKGYYNGIDAEIYWCKIDD